MSTESPNARLYFILARSAPVGVIFRRGPSKWVQIIRWNTKTDEFTPGQWFHGRIYEERSDLSPDGTKMIYFAQKITRRRLTDTDYTYAWTAISKPPYLTALTLWPKGNCWHGGGLFDTDNSVWLNHRPAVARPHPNHPVPRSLKVTPNPEAHGEDGPVLYSRLMRDGWALSQDWDLQPKSHGYETRQPEILKKRSPSGSLTLVMHSSVEGYDLYRRFSIECPGGRRARLDCAQWADLDQRGRLVFVSEGKVFSAGVDEDCEVSVKELADLNDAKPEPIRPPAWAKTWGRRP